MSVSEILDGLLSNGYKFASPEPKKNLFARIYWLKGVKQVGFGKFAAESSFGGSIPFNFGPRFLLLAIERVVLQR